MRSATGRLRELLDREKDLACQTGKTRFVRAPDGSMIAIITVSHVRDRELEAAYGVAEHRVPVAFVHLTKTGGQRIAAPWSPSVSA